MKKTILAILFSSVLCHSAFADEKSKNMTNYVLKVQEDSVLIESEDATENQLLDFFSICKAYAFDENIADNEWNSYILDCMNGLLTNYNYQSISVVPFE